ncbi:MAG: hypothetical protein AAFU71_16725, partial [Cyanobacteria bacterium J06632_22]
MLPSIRSFILAGSVLLTATPGLPTHARPPALPIIFQENFDPPGDDAPDQTVGAGSRTNMNCADGLGQLRSHMPDRNYGLTTQSRPGVYVQLPATNARRVLLAFRNEA